MGPGFPGTAAGYPEASGDPVCAFDMVASAEDPTLVFGPFGNPCYAG